MYEYSVKKLLMKFSFLVARVPVRIESVHMSQEYCHNLYPFFRWQRVIIILYKRDKSLFVILFNYCTAYL